MNIRKAIKEFQSGGPPAAVGGTGESLGNTGGGSTGVWMNKTVKPVTSFFESDGLNDVSSLRKKVA
jgi:hypothetical protein